MSWTDSSGWTHTCISTGYGWNFGLPGKEESKLRNTALEDLINLSGFELLPEREDDSEDIVGVYHNPEGYREYSKGFMIVTNNSTDTFIIYCSNSNINEVCKFLNRIEYLGIKLFTKACTLTLKVQLTPLEAQEQNHQIRENLVDPIISCLYTKQFRIYSKHHYDQTFTIKLTGS